ncbi:RNA-binding S4 domain-containing protein [Pseudaestuariivita rosea]|uniref:RNA-binding S4 domain-containing protein n=1 Tax=Pseudaestuariivita rosea TaxID=2763263 RepID=UPI001ABAED60|nr:RNA-binding S4 domain-containing protein [Pseudaestuariivita rosea]
MIEAAAPLRLDKWLWYARFFKTRSLATKVVTAGKVRVDGVPVSKPSRTITPGAVLTFPQGRDIRVVRIVALADRRGPATEAQTLYEDLTPVREKQPQNPSYGGKGRPTKKDARKLRHDRTSHLE